MKAKKVESEKVKNKAIIIYKYDKINNCNCKWKLYLLSNF